MDPAIEGDELRAQRDFLRRLARGLLGDDASAEDVVQEAELRALGGAPEGRPARRAWLATVTRRLALNVLRSRERRERHERAAARPEAAPHGSPEDAALAGLELQREVLAAVRALDEPRRTAVWLRYYEGLEPAEIARRLGAPLATVKTRLRRALAELRARLDQRHGGERGAWAAVLAPLAARSAVVGIGGALAMKKVAVAATCLVLALVGWRVSRARDGVPAAPVTAALAAKSADVAASAARATSAVPPAASRAPAPAAADPAESLAAGAAATLDVLALFEARREPASAIGLVLWPAGDPRAELRARTAETDDAGRARFEGVEPGRWVLHGDREQQEELELAAGEARALELVLPEGVDVLGGVVDGEGRPLAGADVWLEGSGGGTLGGRVVARSGADGGFRLRGVGERQGLSAFAAGFAPAPLVFVRERQALPGERELRVTLVLSREGHALLGRVLDPDGRPVAAARVALGSRGNAVRNDGAGGSDWRPRARVLATDETGAFRADWIEGGQPAGLAPVRAHVLAPGFALAAAESAQPTAELTVRLERGATIEGVVRGPDGAPAAGAELVVLRCGAIEAGGCPFDLPSARAASDGSFRIEHVPSGEVELFARTGDPRVGASATRTLADGELARWDLALARALAIVGRVVNESGAGLASKHVLVGDGTSLSAVTSDADGLFRLATDEGKEWRVALMGPGGVLDAREGVRAGDEVELVWREPRGAVRGALDDRAGLARAGERLQAQLDSAASAELLVAAHLDELGAFEFRGVVPGRYRVTIDCGGSALVRGAWFDLAEDEERDLGTIETRAPGSLALECTLPPGAGPNGARARLLELEGSDARPLRREGELLRADGVAPGRYRLEVEGDGLACVQRPVEVREGEELALSLALAPGVQHRLAFAAPSGARVERLSVAVRELAGGAELVREAGSPFPDQPLAVVLALAPGRYSVEAAGGGLAASGALEVAEGAGGLVELAFDLR